MKIDEKRLRELERAEKKLQALEAGGVDNWEWYSESLRDFYKEEQRAENIDLSLFDEFEIIDAYESDD